MTKRAIGLTGASFHLLSSSETHYISQLDLELMEILLPQAGMTYFTGAFRNKHPGTLLEEKAKYSRNVLLYQIQSYPIMNVLTRRQNVP